MDEYHYLSLLDEAIVTSPTGFTSKAHFSLWKPKEEGFKQNEEEKSGIVPNESDSDVFGQVKGRENQIKFQSKLTFSCHVTDGQGFGL